MTELIIGGHRRIATVSLPPCLTDSISYSAPQGHRRSGEVRQPGAAVLPRGQRRCGRLRRHVPGVVRQGPALGQGAPEERGRQHRCVLCLVFAAIPSSLAWLSPQSTEQGFRLHCPPPARHSAPAHPVALAICTCAACVAGRCGRRRKWCACCRDANQGTAADGSACSAPQSWCWWQTRWIWRRSGRCPQSRRRSTPRGARLAFSVQTRSSFTYEER